MEHVDKVHEKKHQDQGATKNALLRWGYVLHRREEGSIYVEKCVCSFRFCTNVVSIVSYPGFMWHVKWTKVSIRMQHVVFEENAITWALLATPPFQIICRFDFNF